MKHSDDVVVFTNEMCLNMKCNDNVVRASCFYYLPSSTDVSIVVAYLVLMHIFDVICNTRINVSGMRQHLDIIEYLGKIRYMLGSADRDSEVPNTHTPTPTCSTQLCSPACDARAAARRLRPSIRASRSSRLTLLFSLTSRRNAATTRCLPPSDTPPYAPSSSSPK